jgi:hypothetical protein
VSKLADDLLGHLSTEDALARIQSVNQPGRSSAEVQATFGDFVRELGFESERVGLFSSDEFALRPDCFIRLGQTGILLEVERGKTTINNMDLLDFWKCHLCRHAHYLFLLVPMALRQNPTMSPRDESPQFRDSNEPSFQSARTPSRETSIWKSKASPSAVATTVKRFWSPACSLCRHQGRLQSGSDWGGSSARSRDAGELRSAW